MTFDVVGISDRILSIRIAIGHARVKIRIFVILVVDKIWICIHSFSDRPRSVNRWLQGDSKCLVCIHPTLYCTLSIVNAQDHLLPFQSKNTDGYTIV